MCCTSFPTLSLCLANLYNSFSPSFVSNLAYKSSYAYPFAIATAFFALLFVYLFSIFIFYFISCFFCLFSFMLSCISSFHHHVCLSPFHFPNVTPSTVSAVFLAFPLFCCTHQITHPCLPKSWSPLL